ncbi:MAG: hypothetical protein KAT31_11780, partial [Bacteroidales bacterium]|nr:hypothetical protein [Bacteroidales bacterium]
MKNFILSILAFSALLISSCNSGEYAIDSPDSEILVTIMTGDMEESDNGSGILRYSVMYMGQEIVGPSELGLEFR